MAIDRPLKIACDVNENDVDETWTSFPSAAISAWRGSATRRSGSLLETAMIILLMELIKDLSAGLIVEVPAQGRPDHP